MRKIVPSNAVLIPETAAKVFDGQIFDVYQWQQQLFDGAMSTYEQLRRPDTVLVVGVADDTIVLIDDEQAGRDTVLRLPGGRVETTDESTLAAAQREILEETGYEFANWKLVNVVQPETKLEWFVYIYIADTIVSQKPARGDEGERITVRLTSFSDVVRYVHEGRGWLGKNRELFEDIKTFDDLHRMPEFHGQVIDR